MAGALDDLRVIELGGGEGLALCGRLLAELGAEVVRVEPPGGDPLRRVPPRWAESSYLFEMLAAGKRSLVLDLDSRQDAATLCRLLATADVLIEGEGAACMAARKLDYAALGASHPRLIYCSLTPFGEEGPAAGRPGADIIAQALGGLMAATGFPDELPTKTGPALAEFSAAFCAAIGILAALYHRDATGCGQGVDVSAQDGIVILLGALLARTCLVGQAPPRLGNRHPTLVPCNTYPTTDGWVAIAVADDEQWRWLCHAIGHGYLAADGRFAHYRERAARVAEVDTFLAEWTKERSLSEIVARLNAAGVPVSPVRTIADLFRDRHFLKRGMVIEMPHAAGPLRVPGSVFKLSRTPGLVHAPAPAAGECRAGDLPPRPTPPLPTGPAADAGLGPLAGLRVLDLTHLGAGPLASRLLADLGAEVIKVEPPECGDRARYAQPLAAPGISYPFQIFNHGKLGLALDLSQPRGSAILRDLARDSDVIFENDAVGEMDKLGLGHAALALLNPRLVYCSITGFGQTGPDSGALGLDLIVQARSGLMSLGGWPGGPPHRAGTTALDCLASCAAALAALAALHYRHRSRLGQRADVSLFDVAGLLTYTAWPALCSTGVAPQRYGNRYPFAAPYNAFRARDGFVAIGVVTDRHWRALRCAMGRWAAGLGGSFDTLDERLGQQEEIEAVVAAWVAAHEVQAVVEACLAGGVPAAPVLDMAAVVRDPHLVARGMLSTVSHPRAGVLTVTGLPLKLSATPGRLRGPAPDVGQHTAAILATRLHYRAADVAHLKEGGVI